MQYCEKCGVSVAGARRVCPLCQSPLQPLEETACCEQVFPLIPPAQRQYSLFFKLIKLAAIAIAVISITINVVLQHGWWAQYVVLGVACAWFSLDLAVRKRKNIPKNLLEQALLISAVGLIWDLLIGWKGWSIDFVMPIVFLSAIVAIGIIVLVTRVRIEHCILYFCLGAFFCIIPLVLLLTGVLRQKIPSLICVAGGILLIAALFLFFGEQMKAELRRRLHL